MQQTDRVLLLIDDRAAGAALRTALESRGSRVRLAYDGLAALAALRTDPFDLVVVDVESQRLDVLDLLAAMPDMPQNASTPVMALVDASRGEERLALFQLGVDEVAVKPVSPLEFVTRARRLLSHSAKPPTLHRGRVTAFLGVAGGVGVTTIVANLAEILGGRSMTIALDLAWPLGGLAPMLALPSGPGLEAVAEADHPAAAFPRYLVGGTPRLSFRALPGLILPPRPDLDLSPAGDIVREARSLAAHVLVDLGTGGGPWAAEVIAEADIVVLVLGLDRTQFSLGRLKLDWLDEVGSSDRNRLVLANRTQPSPLGHRDAQRSLEEDVFLILPNEGDRLSECLNQGRLLVTQHPSSAVTVALTELASAIDRMSAPGSVDSPARGLP